MTADPPVTALSRGKGTTRSTADREKAIRVLVVDDEPSICQALSALFGLHGLEVVTVLTAAEALNALATSAFDVLLIDLRLRDRRGDVLFREAIGANPAFRDRTLFMTGDITAEAERIIAETNCPFLHKPFDITLAVQSIAALLGITYNPDAEDPPAAEPDLRL